MSDSKKWMVAAACALVGGTAIYVTVFRSSEEDRVKETLSTFIKAVEVKQDDNILSRAGRVRSKLKDTVDDLVRVDVAEMNIAVTGRDKLAENATKLGLVYSSASCELVGTKIEIDPGATTAKVDTTAIVTGLRGGERKLDKRDVHFLLHKDGTWRISSIDVAGPSS